MSSRKTVSVLPMLRMYNIILSNPDNPQEVKAIVSSLLENILHKSNNYAGFGYLFRYDEVSEEYRKAHEYDRSYYYSDLMRDENRG